MKVFLSAVAALLLFATFGPRIAQAQGAPAPGGSNQRASTEGCMGETLFNGIWRVKVLKSELTPNSSDPHRLYWGVTIELRNGRNKTLALNDLGVGRPQLGFPDGTTLDFHVDAGEQIWIRQFNYRKLPPGGVAAGTLLYKVDAKDASDVKTPTKLLIDMPKGNLGHPSFGYPVADPSMRIRLDCTK